MGSRIRIGCVFFTLVYIISLSFFYLRYVPLIDSMQMILVPALFFVFALTSMNPQKGTLFFVFAFPLINNLPYFFGIFENTPHAPTALVLFLFYFLGLLINKSFSGSISNIYREYQIFKPLYLFSILIVVSAVVTFFRYSNFFPFLSDYIYELITNVKGVTAGGAIMSTVFFSLNYLTGIAFFCILLDTLKSEKFIKKITWIFCWSMLLSLSFGLFQHFNNLDIGNNLRSISQGLINGTFTDALSLGTFVAMVFPLLMGLLLYLQGKARILPFVVLVLSLYIIFFTGSKSGLFCLVLSIFVFLILSIKMLVSYKKSGPLVFKKSILIPLFAVLFVGALIFVLMIARSDSTEITTLSRSKILLKRDLPRYFSTQRGHLWQVAGFMMRDYPLSGVGVGGYIIESSNYAEIHRTSVWNPQSAENYILQVGSEFGFVGIFLVLWIFWEIIKKMRQSHLNIPNTERKKYILFGATAGVISFLVNIQVHSFIGSYEIKYTFWFLVALIICLGRKGKKIEEKLNLSKNFKIMCVISIILFGAVHLWNSTHSLSLEQRTKRLHLKQDFGFYPREQTNVGKNFRWTKSYGGITVTIKEPVIDIPLYASHPDIQINPVRVKIFLLKDFFNKKRLLDEIVLTRSVWKNYEFYIPEEINEEVILLFKVSRTWNPLKSDGTPDPRNLGIAIGEIQFRRQGR